MQGKGDRAKPLHCQGSASLHRIGSRLKKKLSLKVLTHSTESAILMDV